MASSSRVLLFALAAALLALALAGPARARVLQQGGGNNNPSSPPSPPRPAPPPPVPLPPKKPSAQMARSWYPQQQQPGRYWYPPQGRGWMPSGYPGAREGPGRGYYDEGPEDAAVGSDYPPAPLDGEGSDPYADTYNNNSADYYGGGAPEQTPYYDGGGYEDNSNAYPAPAPPSRANTPDGRWLPCWLFHDIEAAIAWGLVDPTQCWPHSPSPSPVPSPSPIPPPPSPLPSVSPIPPPPSPSPTPEPSPSPQPPSPSPPIPDPSPIPPPPSPSPVPPPPSPSPQPPSPSPFPPFSPIPPPPNPRPPIGKVVCIPGDICRTAKYACEMDTICDQWGQCPPSQGIPREENFVCRPAAGECDQDEYCNGELKCGPDAFQPAGTPCVDINGNDSVCFGGKPEKAEDPYEAPRAGPKGFYKEPPSRWPKGLLRRLTALKGEPRAPPASSSPIQPFVVVDYASSAEAGARRYKYNPRVCPLSAYDGNDDDDDDMGGGRKGGKHGK